MSIENGCDYFYSCTSCAREDCLVNKQKAKIKQLEIEVDKAYDSVEKIGRNAHRMCSDLEDRNAELQKQVDELEKYKEFVDACKLGGDIEIVMNRIKPYPVLREKAYKQAVKDTAQEIYDWFKNGLWFLTREEAEKKLEALQNG